MDKKFLFITEDGSLVISVGVPPEALEAFDEGIWDIVNMETGQQYVGNGCWESIEDAE